MSIIETISTRDMNREQWLEARRAGIGGSDAAAIVGMNPYSTPWSVWADKMGISGPKEETEAMRLGTYLEPYVADRFCELSALRVRRVNAIIYNPKLPWALANIDRRVVGEEAGLECKTTSAWNTKAFKGGEFPDRYYVQCVHYLAVTEWRRWYLAALVMGEGVHVYQMTRVPNDTVPAWCEGSVYVDQEEIDSLMGAEADFWTRYCLDKTPPPADGDKQSTSILQSLYSPVDGDADIGVFGAQAAETYIALRGQKQALEKEMERCKQVILQALAGANRGHSGRYSVSNAESARRTLDTKALQAAMPTLNLEPYYKVTTSSNFTVKESKQ